MIKKFLLIRESPSATLILNHNATPKTHFGNDLLPKTTIKRWNQTDLGYFNSHLNNAYGEGEIVLVGKNVYYRNVMLFVQYLQNLVIFRDAALVKANIAISLQGSALDWYNSELSNFNRKALNNNPSMNSWVNTLFHRFKISTSVALGLLTNETYTLENA